MVAEMKQAVQAIAEAERYPRPSIIIAYAPCINHGIKKGMGKSQDEEKLAVECGYWQNFRFNPAAEKPFTLDSKAPDFTKHADFLNGEVRYSSLALKDKERAKRLQEMNLKSAEEHRAYLESLNEIYNK